MLQFGLFQNVMITLVWGAGTKIIYIPGKGISFDLKSSDRHPCIHHHPPVPSWRGRLVCLETRWLDHSTCKTRLDTVRARLATARARPDTVRAGPAKARARTGAARARLSTVSATLGTVHARLGTARVGLGYTLKGLYKKFFVNKLRKSYLNSFHLTYKGNPL